ncbi:putative 54S ribosomal protein YmL6, mitochondrial precursor [Phyllosticta citriasiana]|uniref:Large ribosomal subunit protein uL4m n=1 Tax=Phyllosticta citriasiana TaxID=595635 RepID=A0ABR1KC79_9PEZI
MASKRAAGPVMGLASSTTRNGLSYSPVTSTPSMTRSISTDTRLSDIPLANPNLNTLPIPKHLRQPNAYVTLYRFPTMEPKKFMAYPSSHLLVPLRKDILHRAVVYEGDKTRQGTANTKWRDEINGSGRKLRPQKGMGAARLGDRGSPMLKGGGVAFGPKPRDFATGLNRKVYDLAWRMALSFRYRRGELIVVEDNAELRNRNPNYVREVFEKNKWGNADGRTMVVTTKRRPMLFDALAVAGETGRAKIWDDVDVKNVLSLGRLIFEKSALDKILEEHQSDIRPPGTVPRGVFREGTPPKSMFPTDNSDTYHFVPSQDREWSRGQEDQRDSILTQ